MATISVMNTSELNTAMAQARAGDTILLASGNYGAFSSGNDYTSAVTIKSANAGAPATFSSVTLNGATGITFDTITFDYRFKAGDALFTTPFTVSGSSNITIRNSIFDGDVASGTNAVDNGYAAGSGLTVSRSNTVTIENNEFKTWYRGLVVDGSSDVNILKNDIHGIRSDGIDFAQVQKVLVENNFIHDFRAAPASDDHADMIQVITAGTSQATSDLTIRNNTLDIGQGSWTQSIFMGNEIGIPYRNVSITNNTISNAHLHGITVGDAASLTVSKNILISALMNLGDAANALYAKQYGITHGIEVPTINLDSSSQNVVATGNIYSGASWFSGARFSGFSGQSDWIVSGNSYSASTGSIPTGTGSSDSGSITPPDVVAPDPVVVTPTPPSPVSTLPVLDDYKLNIAGLAKTAFIDNAKIAIVDGDQVIRLDGNKDYVYLGRLAAFEKSTKISFEINFNRDIADGKEARLVWNHMKFGLAVVEDGLKVQVATARDGFKTIRVDNLGLNDTDNHTIRVIMDEVSNHLQVFVDGKVVLNTSSTDLKFVGASGYEHGWMLGSAWERYFDGDISDFRIEAKADFVNSTSTTTAVATTAGVTATPSIAKASVTSLFGTTIVNKTAVVEKTAVQTAFTDTNKVAVVDTHHAVDNRLAGLFDCHFEKAFVVGDTGKLVHAATEKAAPVLSSFASLIHTKAVAPAASVVVDTGADRLQVILNHNIAQNDDDLDAHMADSGGNPILAHVFGADSYASSADVDVAPIAHIDIGFHHFDGHALFG